jgi:hypothetical protein
MSSKKSLSFKIYVQNFLCLFISISVYCLSSQSHWYWFLTHKYLVNSIYYEAFRDVFDFLFTTSLPGTSLFFTAYKHTPLYSKIYVYIFFFLQSSQPSHLVEWCLTMSFFGSFLCSVKLLTVWVHITHRINCGLKGHKLCHSGISLMGLQIFQVNCSKVFVCFHLCTSVPHFGNSC